MSWEAKNYCFCIKLKLGCYLIGTWGLVGNAVTAVLWGTKKFDSWIIDDSKILFYLVIIGCYTSIFFNIVLLYGLKKDRKVPMSFAMLYRLVVLAVEVFIIIFYADAIEFSLLFIVFIEYLLSIYNYMVLSTYFRTIPDQPLAPAPGPAPTPSPSPSPHIK